MSNKIILGAIVNSGGNILTVVSGLISFPILTRLLSENDYGLMSLLNTTIFISVGFGKCGIQQALLRLWKSDRKSNVITFSTAIYGVLMISCAVVVVTLFFLSAYLSSIRDNNLILLSIVAGTILIDTLRNVVIIKELALERTVRYNIAQLLHKYIHIIVAIALLMTINTGVTDVIYGFYTASVVIFAWLYISDINIKASLDLFDAKLFKQMVAFGFPLLIVEVVGQALSFSDRYFIAYYVDIAAVGQYSASYNFIFNIQYVVITVFSLTISPVVVRKYNTGGDDAVRVFLNDSMKLYFCIGSATTLGLFAVGPDVFILMASSRYEQAIPLLKPVISGYFLYGIYTIAAYNLFIRKRTVLSAMFMAAAAVVSIATNIVLLPRIGVMGAAISTFAAYAVLALIGFWLMWRMRFLLKLVIMIPYFIPSAAMYWMLLILPASRDWMSIGYRVLVGGLVWMLVAALCFKEVRAPLLKLANKK